MRFIGSLFITVAMLLYAHTAVGGKINAAPTPKGNCVEFTLCNETATGVCADGGTENYFAGKGFSEIKFYSDKSTSSDAWTVLFYFTTPGEGYDGSNRTQLSTTPLTPSLHSITAFNVSGDWHAVIGGTLSSDEVIVHGEACALSK